MDFTKVFMCLLFVFGLCSGEPETGKRIERTMRKNKILQVAEPVEEVPVEKVAEETESSFKFPILHHLRVIRPGKALEKGEGKNDKIGLLSQHLPANLQHLLGGGDSKVEEEDAEIFEEPHIDLHLADRHGPIVHHHHLPPIHHDHTAHLRDKHMPLEYMHHMEHGPMSHHHMEHSPMSHHTGHGSMHHHMEHSLIPHHEEHAPATMHHGHLKHIIAGHHHSSHYMDPHHHADPHKIEHHMPHVHQIEHHISPVHHGEHHMDRHHMNIHHEVPHNHEMHIPPAHHEIQHIPMEHHSIPVHEHVEEHFMPSLHKENLDIYTMPEIHENTAERHVPEGHVSTLMHMPSEHIEPIHKHEHPAIYIPLEEHRSPAYHHNVMKSFPIEKFVHHPELYEKHNPYGHHHQNIHHHMPQHVIYHLPHESHIEKSKKEDTIEKLLRIIIEDREKQNNEDEEEGNDEDDSNDTDNNKNNKERSRNKKGRKKNKDNDLDDEDNQNTNLNNEKTTTEQYNPNADFDSKYTFGQKYESPKYTFQKTFEPPKYTYENTPKYTHPKETATLYYAVDTSNKDRKKNYENPDYNFQYTVHDDHVEEKKSKHHFKHGSIIKGQYSLVDPNGEVRIVKYQADNKHAFNATVKKVTDTVPTVEKTYSDYHIMKKKDVEAVDNLEAEAESSAEPNWRNARSLRRDPPIKLPKSNTDDKKSEISDSKPGSSTLANT